MPPGGRAVISVILLLLLACRCGPAPLRTISVRVAADEAFRSESDWRDTLRARLRAVSGLYERDVAIRWRLVDAVAWNPAGNSRTGEAMLLDLRQQVSLDGADVLVGVTLEHVDDGGLGRAAPFDRVLLVRSFKERTETDNVAILAHQLAHLFGAQHRSDGESVMGPMPSHLAFDRRDSDVIRLFRDVDFARGADSVHVDRARAWAALLAQPDATTASRARALLNVGMILRASSQPATAVALVDDAIGVAPDDGDAHYLRGLILKDLARRDEALRSLEEAVRLSPTLIDARIDLGILLVDAGRYAEALGHFREAVRIAPGNASARFNLGVALLAHLGQLDEAIEQFQAAIELQPDHADARRAFASAWHRRLELQRRVEEWQLKVRQRPDDAVAHYSLGLACSELGRHTDAALAYQSALRVRADYQAALANLAVSYFALGRYGEARQAVERLSALGGTPREGLLRALDAVPHGESSIAGAPPGRPHPRPSGRSQ